MRSLNKGAAITFGCFALALILLAPPLTHGDEWNLATRFTVNQRSEVPGIVLQANTPYVIRLLDSPSNRNIVQIYDKDQKHMLTMFMAISAERPEPADRTVFKFVETAPGYPLPIKEWFYPGRLNGLEFVYPKDQALSIAEHAREPVLAADTSDLHHLSTITVEAISPKAEETAVTESAANVTSAQSTAVVQEEPSVAENTPTAPYVEQKQEVEQQNLEEPAEIAQNTQPEVQQQPAEPAPAETAPVTEENQELPRTAGELPLVALIGALCLGAGVGMKVLSAKM